MLSIKKVHTDSIYVISILLMITYIESLCTFLMERRLWVHIWFWLEICHCFFVFVIVMKLDMVICTGNGYHNQKHKYSQHNVISMTVPALAFKNSKDNLAVRRTMWNIWTAAAVMWHSLHMLWMMSTSYKYYENHYFRNSYKLRRVLQIDHNS
jgi:hypothetical protein